MATASIEQATPFNESEFESAHISSADFSLSKSSKGLSPVDELTRVPLPILPGFRKPRNFNDETKNWHHHYHPSTSAWLTSVSGLAVRHLRLQYLDVATHNRYHGLFEKPIFLPRSSEDRLGHIVLACAGYIPTHAIDIYSDDPSVPVPLSERMRHRLQTSGEIAVRGHANISNFIKDQLVDQDFSNVKPEIIDEFVNSNSTSRRQFLGHWLLAIASEQAVEPIKPIYRQALDEGLILRPDRKIENQVKKHVNGRATSQKAIKKLHKRLAKEKP